MVATAPAVPLMPTRLSARRAAALRRRHAAAWVAVAVLGAVGSQGRQGVTQPHGNDVIAAPLPLPLPHHGGGGRGESRGGGGGCTGGGNLGCSPPVGPKWDRWDMAGSTYAYCYAGCHMPWFINNRVRYNLSAYAGVVGVDHYWTGQGVPCTDGQPHEFAMQDALADSWKEHFPEMRFLSYRIPSAVPYDAVIRAKIVSDPDFFVRWKDEPDAPTKQAQQCPASGPGNCSRGAVCYNNISPCFNDVHRINAPNHSCSFKIQAAAYNWLNPAVGPWYIDAVVLPSLVHGDGIWLDGNGYDNGAWMCSGICCGFDATNSPQTAAQIAAFCAAQTAVATSAREQLIARGGFDGLNCVTFMVGSLPQAEDAPATCAQKLQTTAVWAANHSNYHAVVAYGYDTGAGGYNSSTAAAAIAAFLLMRGQHWLFGIGVQEPCNPQHYPVTGRCHSDGCGKPCSAGSNSVDPDTAALLVTDYGRPLGSLEPVVGQPYVFRRRFEKATVQLDCASFAGSVHPPTADG